MSNALSSSATAKGRLQRACLEILRAHQAAGELPTSARFIYYQLKQAGYPLKHHAARRDDQDVIDAVMYLRKCGEVPWSWLADETRSVEESYAADSVAQCVLDTLPQARIDPWDGHAPPVIITESRGVRAALRTVAERYAVTITSTNGQVGGFLRTDVAPLLTAGQYVGYVGDWNPAGSMIEANTRRVLERAADGQLRWERLAVTVAQAAAYRLPPKPGTDRRYANGNPHTSYEAEAVGQGRLAAMLTNWLNERLPEPLERVQERERVQRERVREALRELSGEA
jgi:hypothetical protein